VVSVTDPYGRILGFLDREIRVLGGIYPYDGRAATSPTHLLRVKPISAE
jgi:hypothetical protein